MKQKLGIAVLICTIIVTGLDLSAAEAAVPASSANLCGWACTHGLNAKPGTGEYASAQRLIDTLAPVADKPWLIAVQEVCVGQLYHLANTFQQWGYTTHFGYSLRNSDYRTATLDCTQFGNAVFMRGNLTDKFKYSFPDQVQGSQEIRNITCQRMNGNFLGCSTHLAYTGVANDPLIVKQANSARDYVDYWFGGHLRLTGGDFNLSTLANLAPNWPAYHWSVNQYGFKTATSPAPLQQYDYMWASKSNFPAGNRSALADCGTQPASDHCYLYGTFTS